MMPSTTNGSYRTARSVIGESNISPHDVLLGRGATLLNFTGNVVFRKTVQHKLSEYLQATEQIEKDQVARDVMGVIKRTGGRFFRKLDSKRCQHGDKNDIKDGATYWIVVDDTSILRKVKQAFRDLKKGDSDTHQGDNSSKSEAAATVNLRLKSNEREALETQSQPAHTLPSSLNAMAARSHLVTHLLEHQSHLALPQAQSLPPPMPHDFFSESCLRIIKQRRTEQQRIADLSSSYASAVDIAANLPNIPTLLSQARTWHHQQNKLPLSMLRSLCEEKVFQSQDRPRLLFPGELNNTSLSQEQMERYLLLAQRTVLVRQQMQSQQDDVPLLVSSPPKSLKPLNSPGVSIHPAPLSSVVGVALMADAIRLNGQRKRKSRPY